MNEYHLIASNDHFARPRDNIPMMTESEIRSHLLLTCEDPDLGDSSNKGLWTCFGPKEGQITVLNDHISTYEEGKLVAQYIFENDEIDSTVRQYKTAFLNKSDKWIFSTIKEINFGRTNQKLHVIDQNYIKYFKWQGEGRKGGDSTIFSIG